MEWDIYLLITVSFFAAYRVIALIKRGKHWHENICKNEKNILTISSIIVIFLLIIQIFWIKKTRFLLVCSLLVLSFQWLVRCYFEKRNLEDQKVQRESFIIAVYIFITGILFYILYCWTYIDWSFSS